jgi:hypothetical protein
MNGIQHSLYAHLLPQGYPSLPAAGKTDHFGTSFLEDSR